MWTPDSSIIVTAAAKAEQAQAATLAAFQAAIQAHVDAAAQAKSYADGNACASYVASTVAAWAAEAQAFVAWRDAVWTHVYAELDKVQAGERAQPQVDAFIAELPSIEWPEG
jgi:hypothetical protein